MENVKIKWLGTDPTLIRTEKNGEKVDVLPNAIVEVSVKQGEFYTKQYKGSFVYVTGEVQEKAVKKGKSEDKKIV